MKTKTPLHRVAALLALAILTALLAPQLRAQTESTNTNETSYIQPLWGGLITSDTTETTAEETTSYTIGDGDTGGTLSFGGSTDGSFQAMSSGIPLEGSPGTLSSFATTTINFDTAGNWTQGSAALGSYATNHVYVESGWTFTGGPALRNGTAAQDGFAGALGTYSWRLRDAAGVVWTGTYNTGGTLSAFGFDVRRWDGSPDPSFSIDYSVDGGASFTSTGTTINNAFLNNSSDWTTFSFSLLSPTTVAADDFIVRVSRLNGERIMIDNFSYTTASAAFTTWTGTGSGGTWSDGTEGNFGGNYANSLANTVTLTGTGEAITTSGTPQAGSLTFNADSYVITGALQLGVGTITVTTGGQTATISANISGDSGSGLTKEGAGNLVLSGSNNYAGAAAINAGTLEMQSADALGTTALGTDVGSGATLALSGGITTAAEALTLAGTGVSGGGALRSLSGNNTYSGAITLDGAARINSDAGTLTLDVAAGNGISGNFGLTFGGAGNIVVSDAIATSGGSLTKDGAGTLTLLGANTYSGGTLISAGEVIGSTTSLQGNITNNATLTFDQSGSGTYAGAISGSGTLVKDNTGTVILTGNNSQTTGGTLVIDGTLQIGNGGTTGSLAGTIDNDGTLIFSRSDNITQSAVISGLGALTKQGAGTLTMSAVNTFSGATTVSAGELVVNGTNASSAVTVSSGATLSGSGQVGDLTISGLLSPGNSIGTLSAGNTTFAADGAFQLEVFDWTGSAGTGWDLLAITGDLTISSTSLNPFTIDLVSFSDATTPGFSVNFNANQSFTNTFVTYSGSLIGFGSDLFVVDASSFLNATNGTFSITNVSGGLALLYTTAFDPGASYDWNAGSGDWSVAGNWAGNVAPVNDSLLIFTGAAGTATNNAAVTSVTGLKFSNTTGSIVLAGDAFALGEGGIENDSANVHTISNNMSLAANASILAVSNGLTIAGNITNDTASRLLSVGGSENTTISGVVSGVGDLSKIGLGTLTLSGPNTFTGSFTINGGEAVVSGTAATTTIAVNVGGTLSLGAADALANGATVTVDAGTFNTATFNDTIGTLVLTNGGTVSGTGVLGATTFTLGGGTVSGALGAGTANVSGEVSLTGTMDSTTINLNSGGTLTLGSADRIGGSTAVVIGGGTLAMGANNDTVGTFSITSGTLGGTGTLTASTYSLGGGTISANLGTGSATAATGTTTVDGNFGGTLTSSGGTVDLNGTLADDLTVSSGAVNLGSADRLGDTSDVSISGGTLGMGANNDTVGTFAITGGTLDGTGTLTAATYALNGGTIGANLGAGAATASSGTTTLNGTLDSTTLGISGGTLVLGSPGRIGNATAVTLSSGQLDTATFTDSVGSFTMTGGTLAGTGQINSAAYDLQGGTVNANLGTGTATVSSGTTELNGNLGGNLTASSGVANVGGTIGGDVTVSGGTVNVESADRIGNTSAVSVSSGTLDFAANDTVGAVQLTGGTITGAGTVTGASYDVQSGTISAALAGAGAMTKTGAGTTTLSANNSGYSGAVAVNEGAILASTSGALGTNTVTMSSGSTLAASGVTLANNFTIGTAGGNVTNNFTAYWNFGTAAGDASATTTTGTGLTFGTVSQGNNNGTTTLLTTTAASSGYDGASGTFNAGASARTGVLNTGASGSAYFEFSLTADSGYSLSLTNLTFGSRSTTTGPQLATLLSSIDSYATALATNALGNNSTWTLISPTVAASSETNGVVTFRIYGSAGTGSASANTANWRIDDLNIAGFTVTGGGLPSGSGTLGIEEAGTATFSGNVVNNNAATFTAASGGLATFSGIVSGEGTLNKTGAGTVTLSGNNSYSGGTTLSAGVLRLESATGAGTGTITQSDGTSTIEIDTTGTVANAMDFHNLSTLQTVTLSGNKTLNNSTYTVASGTTTTESGILSGTGGITKEGTGTLLVTGDNTFSGATAVNAGVLELASTVGGAAASTSAVSVANGATLLISQSNQINDNANVSLSGGTITRGSGVSEVFGNLNLTASSFLDFGSGTSGNLQFGTYSETGSAILTLNSFFGGNTLRFATNLSGQIDATYNGTSFTSQDGLFVINSISGGFTSNWDGSTFTITAIPEPSTYLAAAGLLSLMLWPSRKRLIKDAKKILGMTPPMRDRLAAKRA